jgi:hypothetical protein
MNERTSQINNFNNILPRSVYSEVDKELIEKKSNISGLGNIMSMQGSALFGNIGAGQGNIYRNPARRFYDPQINTTSIYLPQTLKQKNRWNRWFFNHDEMIGTVLELHAELPYSRFEMLIDDPYIRRQYEECVDITNFFSMLPLIDLEYQKVGEVIIHTPWNEKKGMWESIVIHNPDFIEIKYNPFADQESSIELIPDNELKGLIHSTKPEEQQLKKRLPKDIVKRVLNGKNIILDPSEVTHIARRSSPYDIRGTSMIERVYRLLMYEDKLREAQITIADNFIYPLKIFKLGDAQKGWIPPETHQRALAQMLQQAAFDPNFSLIYHYGLQVEYMTVADKIMRTDHEWDEINKKKMIALGVSQQFLNGEATFACFIEGTKVTTQDGISNIEDIQINDKVIDKNGKIKRVENTWDEGIPKEIIEIKLWGNKTLLCTETHNFPVWAWPRKCSCGCGKDISAGRSFAHPTKHLKTGINFIDTLCGRGTVGGKSIRGIPEDYIPLKKLKSSDIKKWDYLTIPRKFDEIKTDITCNQARLLGYFLAEGNYSKHPITKEHTGINLTFSVKERETLVKDAEYICNSIGIPIIQIEERKSSLRLRSSNKVEFKEIINWFRYNAGEYSDRKKLSSDVMRWPLNLKKELIKGLFRGDGCHQIKTTRWNQHRVNYITTSEVLAYQVELILAQIGFPVNWSIINDKRKNRKTCYSLSVYGKFAIALEKLIWEDNCIFDSIESKKFNGQKAWVDDDYVYIMVKSVNKIKNNKKVINLTVEESHSYLVSNISTYNSANVGLQTQLARYKAKRDLFEEKFIKDKFFRKMAEKNEWYARDVREIRGQYRVKRSERELQERVILPKIVWHKKLMMRDDQSHLNFLNNVYAQGKGPVSAITLLMSMGLDLEDELLNKKKQEEIESRLGVWTHPPAQQGNVASRIKEKFKFGKSKNRVGAEESKIEIVDSNDVNKYDLISGNGESFIDSQLSVSEPQRLMKQELENDKVTTKELSTVDDQTWIGNLQSPAIPPEVVFLLTSYLNKVRTLPKKYGSIDKGIYNDIVSVSKHLTDIYLQGKLTAYSETGYMPIYKNYDTVTGELRDFSDMAMSNQFEDWLGIISKIDMPEEYKIRNIRNLAATCFGIGQLKGYQEQGINYVKIGNVSSGDGITYKIGDVLSRGWNMGGVLSPENEIVMFYACIEGYDDEDIGNTLDPHIQRYKTIYANGITIKNCPVEFSSQMERFVNRISKFLKKKYDNIFFVKDITDLPEWEDEFKKKLRKSEIKIDDVILSARIFQEKILKRGKVATFTHNNSLYISSWVGIGDTPLINNILNSIEFDSEFIEKTFGKSYKSSNYDLNREEIDTYKMLGYIEPINPDEPIGWKISNLVEVSQKDSIDEKIYLGKTWNASGKCLKSTYKSSAQVFNENLISWINSPHKLPQNIKKAFEEC